MAKSIVLASNHFQYGKQHYSSTNPYLFPRLNTQTEHIFQTGFDIRLWLVALAVRLEQPDTARLLQDPERGPSEQHCFKGPSAQSRVRLPVASLRLKWHDEQVARHQVVRPVPEHALRLRERQQHKSLQCGMWAPYTCILVIETRIEISVVIH